MTSASFFCIFFISQWHFCHFQIGVVITMAHIFFAFSFFGKNEEFASIFREKQRERKKSTSNNRLRYICLKSSYCKKFFSYSLCFWRICKKNYGTLKKLSQFSRVWPEMKKFNFCFSSPPFFCEIQRIEKKEIFQILAYCVMLQHTSTI